MDVVLWLQIVKKTLYNEVFMNDYNTKIEELLKECNEYYRPLNFDI